jgi:AAA+ superfamily predicted ATPase
LLFGLDEHQAILKKFLGIAINPDSLIHWCNTHHPDAAGILPILLRRPPLAVLAGDVGTGKTVLAETIGDAVARELDIPITLYPMSLTTRGKGLVGEMTHLISEAFRVVYEETKKYKREGSKPAAASILLVDEADALAQSREAAQMHHEDRAGVNAFIRGVDRFSEPHLPAAVIMCTNRLSALDPAIRRRAGEILTFRRPNDEERCAVLAPTLSALGFEETQIQAIVSATGPVNGRLAGCTYSDLTQRLLPGIVMRAFPGEAVDPRAAIETAESLQPTPPFEDQ